MLSLQGTRLQPPVLYPLPPAALLPLPFPEERESLAWWWDAAGCLSCHHAFSLLWLSAQAPPLPLLAVSSVTGMPACAVQLGKLRHRAAMWFAVQWQS